MSADLKISSDFKALLLHSAHAALNGIDLVGRALAVQHCAAACDVQLTQPDGQVVAQPFIFFSKCQFQC